ITRVRAGWAEAVGSADVELVEPRGAAHAVPINTSSRLTSERGFIQSPIARIDHTASSTDDHRRARWRSEQRSSHGHQAKTIGDQSWSKNWGSIIGAIRLMLV